jgi:hypothetical protein
MKRTIPLILLVLVSSSWTAAQNCKGLDLSGSWLVTVWAGTGGPSKLNTSAFKWTFSKDEGCRWSLEMTSLPSNNSVVQSVVSETGAGSKLSIKGPDAPPMVGTFTPKTFKLSHVAFGETWNYSAKRE